ncbi:transposase family protein [Candidatus Beckwithbacteria bacterium]|nr:transposase family protein [Candidatus Beckwithbacteria bacterium]
MKKYGLKPPRLWCQKKFLTKSEPKYGDQFTNLIKDIAVDKLRVNEIWSSDLTYIKYQGEFIYLAAIKDLRSHEIVGAKIDNQHNADLVIKTLKQAYDKQKVRPRIFHGDQGREYLNEACINYCTSMRSISLLAIQAVLGKTVKLSHSGVGLRLNLEI